MGVGVGERGVIELAGFGVCFELFNLLAPYLDDDHLVYYGLVLVERVVAESDMTVLPGPVLVVVGDVSQSASELVYGAADAVYFELVEENVFEEDRSFLIETNENLV